MKKNIITVFIINIVIFGNLFGQTWTQGGISIEPPQTHIFLSDTPFVDFGLPTATSGLAAYNNSTALWLRTQGDNSFSHLTGLASHVDHSYPSISSMPAANGNLAMRVNFSASITGRTSKSRNERTYGSNGSHRQITAQANVGGSATVSGSVRGYGYTNVPVCPNNIMTRRNLIDNATGVYNVLQIQQGVETLQQLQNRQNGVSGANGYCILGSGNTETMIKAVTWSKVPRHIMISRNFAAPDNAIGVVTENEVTSFVEIYYTPVDGKHYTASRVNLHDRVTMNMLFNTSLSASGNVSGFYEEDDYGDWCGDKTHHSHITERRIKEGTSSFNSTFSISMTASYTGSTDDFFRKTVTSETGESETFSHPIRTSANIYYTVVGSGDGSGFTLRGLGLGNRYNKRLLSVVGSCHPTDEITDNDVYTGIRILKKDYSPPASDTITKYTSASTIFFNPSSKVALYGFRFADLNPASGSLSVTRETRNSSTGSFNSPSTNIHTLSMQSIFSGMTSPSGGVHMAIAARGIINFSSAYSERSRNWDNSGAFNIYLGDLDCETEEIELPTHSGEYRLNWTLIDGDTDLVELNGNTLLKTARPEQWGYVTLRVDLSNEWLPQEYADFTVRINDKATADRDQIITGIENDSIYLGQMYSALPVVDEGPEGDILDVGISPNGVVSVISGYSRNSSIVLEGINVNPSVSAEIIVKSPNIACYKKFEESYFVTVKPCEYDGDWYGDNVVVIGSPYNLPVYEVNDADFTVVMDYSDFNDEKPGTYVIVANIRHKEAESCSGSKEFTVTVVCPVYSGEWVGDTIIQLRDPLPSYNVTDGNYSVSMDYSNVNINTPGTYVVIANIIHNEVEECEFQEEITIEIICPEYEGEWVGDVEFNVGSPNALPTYVLSGSNGYSVSIDSSEVDMNTQGVYTIYATIFHEDTNMCDGFEEINIFVGCPSYTGSWSEYGVYELNSSEPLPTYTLSSGSSSYSVTRDSSNVDMTEEGTYVLIANIIHNIDNNCDTQELTNIEVYEPSDGIIIPDINCDDASVSLPLTSINNRPVTYNSGNVINRTVMCGEQTVNFSYRINNGRLRYGSVTFGLNPNLNNSSISISSSSTRLITNGESATLSSSITYPNIGTCDIPDPQYRVISGPVIINGNSIMAGNVTPGNVELAVIEVYYPGFACYDESSTRMNIEVYGADVVTIPNQSCVNRVITLPNGTSIFGTPVTYSAITGGVTLDGRTVTINENNFDNELITVTYRVNGESINRTTSFWINDITNNMPNQQLSFNGSNLNVGEVVMLNSTSLIGTEPTYTIVGGTANAGIVNDGNTYTLGATNQGTVIVRATHPAAECQRETTILATFNFNDCNNCLNLPSISCFEGSGILPAQSIDNQNVTYVNVSNPVGTFNSVTRELTMTTQERAVVRIDYRVGANPEIKTQFMEVNTPENVNNTISNLSDLVLDYGSSFNLQGSSSSGLPITYEVGSGSNLISLVGNSVTIESTEGGTATIIARVAEGNCYPANQKTINITIEELNLGTINVGNINCGVESISLPDRTSTGHPIYSYSLDSEAFDEFGQPLIAIDGLTLLVNTTEMYIITLNARTINNETLSVTVPVNAGSGISDPTIAQGNLVVNTGGVVTVNPVISNNLSYTMTVTSGASHAVLLGNNILGLSVGIAEIRIDVPAQDCYNSGSFTFLVAVQEEGSTSGEDIAQYELILGHDRGVYMRATPEKRVVDYEGVSLVRLNVAVKDLRMGVAGNTANISIISDREGLIITDSFTNSGNPEIDLWNGWSEHDLDGEIIYVKSFITLIGGEYHSSLPQQFIEVDIDEVNLDNIPISQTSLITEAGIYLWDAYYDINNVPEIP